MNWTHWTEEELTTLPLMVANGATDAEIARACGRTLDATRRQHTWHRTIARGGMIDQADLWAIRTAAQRASAEAIIAAVAAEERERVSA